MPALSVSRNVSISSRTHAWLMAVGLSVVTFVLFAPVSNYEFLNFDDDVYVTQNPDVQTGLSLSGLARAFTSMHAANWHPLTWLSLELDAELWGARAPGAFHRTNLLFHTLSTVLLFEALWLMTGACWRSGLVAALFGWHPLHVESVAWVAERKDVLSAFFWMLTLIAYYWYVRESTWPRYLLVFVFLGMGLMAKPMLVTLPAVLCLLDYWPMCRVGRCDSHSPASWPVNRPRIPKRSVTWILVEKFPLWLLVIGACAVTLVAQTRGGSVDSLERLPIAMRCQNALIAYAVYLEKAIAPTHLAPLYPLRYTWYSAGKTFEAGTIMLLITACSAACARRRPYLLVGWLWYLGALVPAIGLVQVGLQSWADRYTYLPLCGLFVMVAWSLGELARSPASKIAIGCCTTVALCSFLVIARANLNYWHDSISLWRHAVQVTPENADAFNNLGHALVLRNQVDQAVDAFKAGLRIKPDHPKLLNNLGKTLAQRGNMRDAEQHYRQAIAADADYPAARLNLGILLARQRRFAEAEIQLREACHLHPRNPVAHNEMGMLYAAQENWDEACAAFTKATQVLPTYMEAHLNLGMAELRRGHIAEAVAQVEAARGLDPADPRVLSLARDVGQHSH